MKKLMGLAVALALVAPLQAAATMTVYTAVLNGPSEVSPNASPGIGSATVTIDSGLSTMRVEESFSGLLGNVTASHIHCCTSVPETGTAGVASMTPAFLGFPTGVTTGSYDHTFDMTLASSYNAPFITGHGGTVSSAFSALVAGLNGGDAYVNIHTDSFPGGEIRGFLHAAPVPEPETYAMFMAGLGLMGFMARCRKTS